MGGKKRICCKTLRPQVEAFYVFYELRPKQIGRPQLHGNQIECLLGISRLLEHKGKNYATAILRDPQAQGIIDLMCKGLNKQQRANKLKRIASKLSNRPDFGGISPHKKDEKSLQ